MPRAEPKVLPIQVGQAIGEPLENPDGALLSTSQNTIGRYKQLLVRPGLTALGNALADNAIGQYSAIGNDGVSNLLIGTPSRWYSFDNTLGTFTDLSGGSLLSGGVSSPIIFTPALQGSTPTIVGVNGPFDPFKTYVLGNAAYTSPAAAVQAVTCMTLAGRVLFGGIGNSGGQPTNPHRVQWTAFADLTTMPATAFSDLSELKNPITAMHALHPTSGAVLADFSQYLVIAQPGTDATAFAIILVDSQPGPVGPAAVCDGPEGTMYYFGSDYNLYRFDGSSAQIVSYLNWFFNASGVTPNFQTLSTTSMLYVPATQDILIAVPTASQGIPTTIVVYNLLTQEVNLWQYAAANQISSLGLWNYQTQTAWAAMPDLFWSVTADTTWALAGITATGTAVVVGLPTSVATMSGNTDLGVAISFVWDYCLPMTPGMEWVFDALEIQHVPKADSLTVQVKVGPSVNELTTYAVPNSPFSMALGHIVASNTLAQEMRGRVLVLSLSGSDSDSDVFRYMELYARKAPVSV